MTLVNERLPDLWSDTYCAASLQMIFMSLFGIISGVLAIIWCLSYQLNLAVLTWGNPTALDSKTMKFWDYYLQITLHVYWWRSESSCLVSCVARSDDSHTLIVSLVCLNCYEWCTGFLIGWDIQIWIVSTIEPILAVNEVAMEDVLT